MKNIYITSSYALLTSSYYIITITSTILHLATFEDTNFTDLQNLNPQNFKYNFTA